MFRIVSTSLQDSFTIAGQICYSFPDYEAITRKTARKTLDDNILAVEKVPICHCVQVMGLNRETTKDAVFYYFDNPKKGGGDVSNVEINTDEGWALVYFEEPQGTKRNVWNNYCIGFT